MMKKMNTTKSLITLLLGMALTLPSAVLAETPQDLYDYVWRNVNSKYVDQTNNEQNWARWRHKYDASIKTQEDAYVAIATMACQLK